MLAFTYLNPRCVMIVRTQPIREKIDPVMEMILKAFSAAGCRPGVPFSLVLISYGKMEMENYCVFSASKSRSSYFLSA